ncbi:cysteine hydrolase family protein [Arthrobacter sp. D1-17]
MSTPRRALILIDVQQQYFDGPFEIQYPPHQESLPVIARAVDAAAAAGIPVVAVQHSAGEGAPVFAPGTPGFDLHLEIECRRTDAWKGLVKQYGSVYANTDLAGWLRQQDIDTVTLVGYMNNNCILASAVEAEFLGFTTEVLSDATGGDQPRQRRRFRRRKNSAHHPARTAELKLGRRQHHRRLDRCP